MSPLPTGQRLDISHALLSERSSLADDVRDGLSRPFKQLAPKHLYDARGCELFEEICTLPEYYPTRTEQAILSAQAARIVAATGAAELVELGAGSATKTRVLLDAMADADSLERYVPFDIAEAAVRSTAEAIFGEYPRLGSVHGVVGDFISDLDLVPPPESDAPRLVALLGSTLGNFIGDQRRELLAAISRLLRPQDHFLLGADLVKDPAVLEAAYNDSRGVTAAFDLNMLAVINRELDGDIPVANFSHIARYDREHEWIEIRLRATEACHAHLAAIDMAVDFAAGEEMRVEISAKFTPERLTEDLRGAGLELATTYTDPDNLFALALARPNTRSMPVEVATDTITAALAETRERTLTLVAPLDPAALEQVHSPLLSPLVWDLGHIAAFEDLWISRTFGTELLQPELTGVYDADETPRKDRGTLPFLRTEAALDYMRRVRARTVSVLAGAAPDNWEKRLELIIRHELQHNETMLQTLQIAGLATGLAHAADITVSCDDHGLELIPLAGGTLMIGSDRGAGFSYDNEQPRQAFAVAAFQIGRFPVSNAAWQDFIAAGGYQRRELWSEAGWSWRRAEAVDRPLYWSADSTTTRRFARRQAINPTEPVCHVSLFEAEAFARHHDARLPTELEWEAAATIEPQGPEQLLHGMQNTVWQWTASEFHAYPGFQADPYREYSEQFFGRGYRVLRGGAWISSARVATTQFRNWDHPERRQIFSGLRLARDL